MSLSAADLATLVLAAAAILVLPGPSVVHVVTRAVAGGRRDALLAVVAVGVGLLVQVVAVAAGLGVLVARSATAESVVRAIGAIALVVLGVRAFRARGTLAAAATASDDGTSGRVLREGVVIGASNPKRLLLLVALLPSYTADDGWPAATQLLVLGLLVAAVALICDAAWALGGAVAGARLRTSRRRVELLGAAAGAVMVGLGVRLALTV